MVYALDPISESEDNRTLGRAVILAAWRFEHRKIRRKSLAYEVNRFRRELSSKSEEEVDMQFSSGDYSRLSFEIEQELKSDPSCLDLDYALRHPFYSCSRIVSKDFDFARLGEETRRILGCSREVIALLFHLDSVAGR